MIQWFVFLFIVLSMILFKYKRRRMYKLASAIPPAATELPFMGIAHKFFGSTENILNTLQSFSYSAIKHDGIVRVWLGHKLYFLAVDPVDVEMMLKTCLEKDNSYRFLKNILGNGILTAPVPIWRHRRKILIPAFSPKVVETFVDVFSEQSQILVTQLKRCEGGKKVSVWSYLSRYTLDAVGETLAGIKINSQKNLDSPALKALKVLLNLISERIFHIWLQPDWLYWFFPQNKEFQKYKKVVYDIVDEIVQRKREEKKTDNKHETGFKHQFELEKYKRSTLLDILIQQSGGEKGYNNIDLREELLTLATAGADTSAVAIGYTLKLLGKYPNIQEKVYQELQEVFGGSDRPLVKEDLVKLKYLDKVIKESLRLFPPAPFIIRKILHDLALPSGRILPAGSGIIISIWGLHRDPKYWGPDAECFDPDRFLPERFNVKHSTSFIPFSGGPRNCIGYQYALMSIKTAVSSIIRHYKIVGEEKSSTILRIKSKWDIMMKAVDDYEIRLLRRTHSSNNYCKGMDTHIN